MDFKKIRGIIVPMLTPFDAEDKVNFEATEQLVNYLIEKGVHGLFPLGTTGEGPLLTQKERQEFAAFVVKVAAGRIPVIIHTGAITTRETVELTEHAQSIEAYGAAVIPPYYFRVSEATLTNYYIEVANHVPDFPIYLYDNPGVTQNHITQKIIVDTVKATDNIVGLKDSSGSLEKLFNNKALRDGNFNTAIGPDGLIAAGVAMGLDASVSGNANVAPELVVAVYKAASSGDMEKARELQTKLNRVRAILRDGADLSMFKGVLAQRGINVGQVRKPLFVEDKNHFVEGWNRIATILDEL